MRLSIEEREQRLSKKKKENEKKKVRVLQEEAKIKREERNIRTQRLIRRGGLVDKAGLSDLNNNAFLGAMLEIKKKASDPATLKRWTDIGDAVFKEEAKGNPKKKLKEKNGCLFIKFEKEPEMSVKNRLKAMKFKWCDIRKEWRGMGDEAEVKEAFPEATINKNSW